MWFCDVVCKCGSMLFSLFVVLCVGVVGCSFGNMLKYSEIVCFGYSVLLILSVFAGSLVLALIPESSANSVLKNRSLALVLPVL